MVTLCTFQAVLWGVHGERKKPYQEQVWMATECAEPLGKVSALGYLYCLMSATRKTHSAQPSQLTVPIPKSGEPETLNKILPVFQSLISSQKDSFVPRVSNATIGIFKLMLGNFVDFILQNSASESFANLCKAGREKILPLVDTTMWSKMLMPIRNGQDVLMLSVAHAYSYTLSSYLSVN